uniref:Cofactor assembly of complex C subunit B n=1 Tax=Chlamydomonas euryale TaxID=1486919 RepID=A0A7R9VDZ5_9CHLO
MTSHRMTRSVAANATSKPTQTEVPDVTYNFVAQNVDTFRALPLYMGALGIIGVIANRIVSGAAPVVDASSGASRVDVLIIFLSAVLLLTGLQWLSLKPRDMPQEDMLGVEIEPWFDPGVKLPAGVAEELRWAWEALRGATRVRSLVLLYDGRNIFHAGVIAPGVRPGGAAGGQICSDAIATGRGNYLANLVLYPGRKEFMGYLPEGTQGVVVQPVGKSGVLIAASDTVRGISRLDQAWISTIADKLEVSIDGFKVSKGVGFGAAKEKK